MYKRQIVMILLTFAVSLWLVKLTWVRIMLLVILACLLIFMSVSYTHLDVYKRQVLGSLLSRFIVTSC